MNHEILKQIIFDQHEIIRSAKITKREYTFEKEGNYVLIGLRRAGKSTLLYQQVKDFIQDGVDWEQIIYINFDDERLLEFTKDDFEDILLTAEEMTSKKHYYYFDEIQNIDGWEKFAIRLAHANEKVDITGSNAKMLSFEIYSKLGGRYLTKIIYPYSFSEFLVANDVKENSSTKGIGKFNQLLDIYYQFGGFPESLRYQNKRDSLSNIYEKILLGNIIVRNKIRGENGMKILMKKIAETVSQDVSYTNLYHALKTIGFALSKDTIIDYCSYAIQSFLLFDVKNYDAAVVDKESNSKFYFSDNGILNLFLPKEDTSLLENIVAIHLHQKYGNDLYYLKSKKTKLDIDFYLSNEKTAIQVCYSLSNQITYQREVDQLIKWNDIEKEKCKLYIITKEENKTIPISDNTIQVVSLDKFLFR